MMGFISLVVISALQMQIVNAVAQVEGFNRVWNELEDPHEPDTVESPTCVFAIQAMSGDDCHSLIKGTSRGNVPLTLEEFQEWNPALKRNCSGVKDGYWYCIGVDNTKDTTGKSSSATQPTASVSDDGDSMPTDVALLTATLPEPTAPAPTYTASSTGSVEPTTVATVSEASAATGSSTSTKANSSAVTTSASAKSGVGRVRAGLGVCISGVLVIGCMVAGL